MTTITVTITEHGNQEDTQQEPKNSEMMTKFEAMLSKQGDRLHDWQRRAAKAFFHEMQAYEIGATGKSWLIRRLHEYIDCYGEEFDARDGEEYEGSEAGKS